MVLGWRLACVGDSLVNHVIGNEILLFRSITIIYVLYFYLVGVGGMANLAVTAVVSLCAHSLRTHLAISVTTTLLFSN
jgi:hypothetical protein